MERIAIVSDIHGNLPALEVVAGHIKSRQVDTVINLGDHLSGPLWPQETARFLMQQDWLHIQGNHDRQLVTLNPQEHNPSDRYTFQFLRETDLDWLRAMPADLHLTDEIHAFHGTPGSDTSYLLESIADGRTNLSAPQEINLRLGKYTSGILLCGHSHMPRIIQPNDQLLIVNPGSVGLPAYENEIPEWYIVETGSVHARYTILEKLNGKWYVEQIALPYDHISAARQAAKNERPDWEIALRSGFMRE
jgi:predicted phosphodiesterase